MDEETARTFQSIDLNTQKLRKLINEAITIQEILKNKNLEKTNIQLDEILKSVIKGYNQKITYKKLELGVSIPKTIVKANGENIKMLIDIILDNAVKFSLPKGKITINLKNNDNEAVLSIKDKGIGIEKNKLKYIFKLFNKVSGVLTYDYEGAGLGLFTAKRIIEAHNGNVKIKSAANSGTEIIITLPKN